MSAVAALFIMGIKEHFQLFKALWINFSPSTLIYGALSHIYRHFKAVSQSKEKTTDPSEASMKLKWCWLLHIVTSDIFKLPFSAPGKLCQYKIPTNQKIHNRKSHKWPRLQFKVFNTMSGHWEKLEAKLSTLIESSFNDRFVVRHVIAIKLSKSVF